MKRYHLPLLFSLAGALILVLLAPFSRGEAQRADDWLPSWVDLNDPSGVHVAGFDPAGHPKAQATNPVPYATPEAPGSANLLDAIGTFFSSLLGSNSSSIQQVDGWETIFSDNFEGTFPGAWDVKDNSGLTTEYYWGKRTCRPYNGTYSAWSVGGGVDGSSLDCYSNYPDNAFSWMIYGPFSLVDAADAELIFKFWVNSETTYDKLFVGASINEYNYYGVSVSGSYDWTERNFDLTNVYTLGDLRGQPQVWIALVFSSDSSDNFSEGAYVDDVQLLKYIADVTTPTHTITPTPSKTATPTISRTNTPTITRTITSTPTRTITSTPTRTRTPTPTTDKVEVALPVVWNQLINRFTSTPTPTPYGIIPRDGNWTGLTNQERAINLTVVSNGTEVDVIKIAVGWSGACGVSSTTYYLYDTPILNGRFSQVLDNGTSVGGIFTTSTSAIGDFHAVLTVENCVATYNGTWSANYVP